MCILLIYSPSPSLSIAVCKISFSTHITPTTLPKYYSSRMLSLNSYTPCSIYIRQTHVKSLMLNLLFVLIAANCRYQTSAFCPFYSFSKPNESCRSHPVSAVGRSYLIRLLKMRWTHSISRPDIGVVWTSHDGGVSRINLLCLYAPKVHICMDLCLSCSFSARCLQNSLCHRRLRGCSSSGLMLFPCLFESYHQKMAGCVSSPCVRLLLYGNRWKQAERL